MHPPLRLAMWSGPRNISTALMRSFEARGDTAVVDEPLYAFYLERTGLEHPSRAAVLASQPTDWSTIAAELTGPVPGDAAIFYQKHMAHHLLTDVGRDWLDQLTHAFLIRDPREMLLSLHRVTPHPRVADTGLLQQLKLFEEVALTRGEVPAVLDARDVLTDPEALLRKLCDHVGIAFSPRMLAWPPGRRDTDGVWAEHWYAAVEASTGFAPYTPRTAPLPPELEPVLAACEPLYQSLYEHRLRA